MHLIYTILALLLAGLLSLTMLKATHESQQRMFANEISTQIMGVADEVFDHAAGYWFDERVDEGEWYIQPPIFPIITEDLVDELTSTTTTPTSMSDGWGGCTTAIYANDPNLDQQRLQNTVRPETCDDLDDLHGLTLDIERGGALYHVSIEVRYVNPATLAPTSSKTFAKEVRLSITCPAYTFNSAPLQLELGQVFTYKRITTAL